MDPRMLNQIGGVGGSLLGILGGVIGTYASIKNTSSPRERAFIVRTAALCWLGVTAFLAALWFTPPDYRPLLWLFYALALPLSLRAMNRRHQQIRREQGSGA